MKSDLVFEHFYLVHNLLSNILNNDVLVEVMMAFFGKPGIERQRIYEFCKKWQLDYFPTSAMEATNINAAFERIIRRIALHEKKFWRRMEKG